jgi:putative radical SAM enzyme (TIGR03279 family)
MVTIKEIVHDSPAANLGLRAGDRLSTVNDHKIYDILGLRFWSSEPEVTLTVQRNGKPITLWCEKDPDEDLGIVIPSLNIRCCSNNCVFCYIDQLPPNLRAPLYVKDEDYRLSFLHGNYVTLTNISDNDLQRVIDERLFPLYVSVHATDPHIRQRLLGLRKPDNILQTIQLLTDHGIRLHTQIVICPGWNDGDILEQTVTDLAKLAPSVQSISLVPVGLTRHRNGLTPLRTLTVAEAGDIMKSVRKWQRQYLQRHGSRLVYPSDEMLLLTKSRIPSTSYYDDFPQVENGVGLIRILINDLQPQWRKLPDELDNVRLTLITGALAAPVLSKYLLPRLQRVNGLNINLVKVKNGLLGESVTVSGLLAGTDILRELKRHHLGDGIVLPPNVLNSDDLFLDDLSLNDFRKSVKIPVFVYAKDGKFPEILRKMEPHKRISKRKIPK